jgi:hypothetical protein
MKPLASGFQGVIAHKALVSIADHVALEACGYYNIVSERKTVARISTTFSFCLFQNIVELYFSVYIVFF